MTVGQVFPDIAAWQMGELHGELAHYLLHLYQKIIEQCLMKHSKRPSSNQVTNVVHFSFTVQFFAHV